MKTVWKFKLQPGTTTIEVPVASEILSVHVQDEEHEVVCVWVLVNPELTVKQDRKFLAIETGASTKETIISFVGTILFDNGTQVYHIFEIL